MLSKKRKNISTVTKAVFSDEGKLVVEVGTDITNYKPGQLVVAKVASPKISHQGQQVLVTNIVAQGKIEAVDGKKLTIHTIKKNPIVSQRAANNPQLIAAEVDVRIIQ